MTGITEAESVIMEALWRRSPLTAEEIASDLPESQGWSFSTIKALINRLLKKGVIDADLDGRRYLYRPAVARTEYILAESQSLLDRLFAGRLAPLVSQFSQAQQLTPEDVAELRRLIDELDP